MSWWWGEWVAARGTHIQEGLNVADPQVLTRSGTEAGCAAGDVRVLLAGDAYASSVRADERRAAELGITGSRRW